MSIDTQQPGMQAKLINRVKAILMTPKTEWPIIAEESTTVADLYKNYIIILAAIPAIMGFLQSSIVGVFGIRVGIIAGLTSAVVGYVMALVGIFILALIIDALAPTFGSVKSQIQALKTAAYAATAAWVASIGQIIPVLGVLILLAGALYSLYLFYLGLQFTMKTPADKAIAYTAVVIVCALVLGIVLSFAVGALTGVSRLGGGFAGSGGFASSTTGGDASSTSRDVTVDPSSPLGALQQYANNLEKAGKDFEKAQQSGDADAQSKALGGALGAVFGAAAGSTSAPAMAPDQLRTFVPERLAGLQRGDVSVERNAALGIQVSQAEAAYSDGSGKNLRLEIMDFGGAAGMLAFAAWANIEEDRQTSTGFERTYKNNGRIMHEEWNQQSRSGEFTVIVGNRVSVKVSGDAPSMDALKSAAESVNLAGLVNAAQASAR